MKNKQKSIKAGYRVHVTTWENDGDNYKTKTVEGLTENETHFLVEFCKLFYSGNQQDGCYGNLCHGEVCKHALVKDVVKIAKKLPVDGKIFGSLQEVVGEFNKIIDGLTEDIDYLDLDKEFVKSSFAVISYIASLFGFTQSEYYTFRVFSEIEIDYIPNEVIIQDATHKFI